MFDDSVALAMRISAQSGDEASVTWRYEGEIEKTDWTSLEGTDDNGKRTDPEQRGLITGVTP